MRVRGYVDLQSDKEIEIAEGFAEKEKRRKDFGRRADVVVVARPPVENHFQFISQISAFPLCGFRQVPFLDPCARQERNVFDSSSFRVSISDKRLLPEERTAAVNCRQGQIEQARAS